MAQTLLGQLGAAPVMLSLLYVVAFLHALGKLRMLRGLSLSLDAKKLFVMSVLLSCLTRTMGFITIGVLNMHSIRLHGDASANSSGRGGPEERFYERTMMVLFDLPDFMIISAYALLAVVWAEMFLQSRRHWLSSMIYKRQLLMGYMVFNAALYAGQLILYLLLFLPSFSKRGVLGAIYLFLTSVNLTLPLLLVVLISYLTFTFSGFPYKSESAVLRMRRVGRVVLVWTIARVVWGLSALTAVLEYQQLVGRNTNLQEQVSSILVMALFLATELYPFVSALDKEVLLAMSTDEITLERGVSVSTSNGSGDGGTRRLPMERGTMSERRSIGSSRPRGLVSTLNAASEGNPTQPLLPRGRKEDNWFLFLAESSLEQAPVGAYEDYFSDRSRRQVRRQDSRAEGSSDPQAPIYRTLAVTEERDTFEIARQMTGTSESVV